MYLITFGLNRGFLGMTMITALRDDERKYATAVLDISLLISTAQASNCCQIIRFMQVQDG